LNDTPVSIVHHDFRQMAHALEGIAGTLHSGVHVDAKDLKEASQVADDVWQAGPEIPPARAALFAEARADLDANAAGAANAGMREAGIAERAAKRMASELRYAGGLMMKQAPRRELPKAVDEKIHELVRRFARNGAAGAA
jgi:hypothetical protein